MAIVGAGLSAPDGWTVAREFDVVQMTGGTVDAVDRTEVIRLGPADVPEMLELVGMTRPGPFGPRTIELGDYVGIRRDGALIAMAGERLRFTGWTEISTVCTAPAHRGQGLASLLVSALLDSIGHRSERAFLHVTTTNTGALRLYERLGFRTRRVLTIAVVAPG